MNKYHKRLKERQRAEREESRKAASLITLHGYFVYRCEECDKEFRMWLQEGCEGPNKKQAVPFLFVAPIVKAPPDMPIGRKRDFLSRSKRPSCRA